MLLSLTALPLWLAFLLLVVVPTAIAMSGPVVVRRLVRLDRLRTNNEVAGFKFATVGVIYAVLLAFVIIVVWEKFNAAENDVAREASATATVYRLSEGLNTERRAAVRSAVTAYLNDVINKDWPAMERGTGNPDVTNALTSVYTTVLNSRADDRSNEFLLTEILRQLDSISLTRRTLLVSADGNVPDILWFVLFGGAIITVSYTFFFGTPNLRAQSLMTGALAAVVFSGLLTAVVIDHPFAGNVRVAPEPLVHVLEDFAGAPRR
jgi:hypothetical protein